MCTTLFQRAGTEEELNAKLTRRVQRAARRQAKQEELRRLHRAQVCVCVTSFEASLFVCLLNGVYLIFLCMSSQIIQRQLEQVEVKQRQLEEKGVAVEKALRGEAGTCQKDEP